MKPDLLITWTKHCDYPIFRAILAKYRDFFGKIVILFSEHMQFPYYDHFLRDSLEELGNIEFIDPVDIIGFDWRNVATNELLKHTDSEWVCSVEQDFFCRDWNEILEKIEEKSKDYPFLGWAAKSGKESFYIHPSFFFIKRELLDKTDKDFSARDGEDHFGWITRDVELLGEPIYDLEADFKCTVATSSDMFHLGGVNNNYLNSHNPDFVFYRPEEFAIYNYWCRKADVPQSPRFTELSLKVEGQLLEKTPGLDLEKNGWTKFFQA